MYTCPKGHPSQAGDYCDECGISMTGTRSVPASRSGSSSGAAAASDGSPCPDCGTPRDGRFCEVCGYDFLLAKLGGLNPAAGGDSLASGSGVKPNESGTGSGAGSAGSGVGPAGGAGTMNTSAGEAVTVSGGPAAGDAPTIGGPAIDGTPTIGGTEAASGAKLPSRRAVTEGWYLTVDADADYHARMQAQAEPGTEPIGLPAYVPPRRFPLSSTQALIGRRSKSRGIEPEIDLSGPPSDPAVSHAHALLIVQGDGAWAIVDLESANGTFVGDETDPIEANVPRPLVPGDVVRLGAFTRIVLQHSTT